MWVAEGKHANYPSQGSCNDGAWSMDECTYNNGSHRIPVVYGQQNIGSRAMPLRDCGPPFWGSSRTDPTTTECMWLTRPFRGWQPASEPGQAGSYGERLLVYSGF